MVAAVPLAYGLVDRSAGFGIRSPTNGGFARKRMIGWRPVALVVLASVLVAITFMDVGSAAACGNTQRLLDSGRFDEARSGFLKLLDDDATHGCATKGLQAVTREQCTRARTLADLGRNEESAKEYASI